LQAVVAVVEKLADTQVVAVVPVDINHLHLNL
jgi:hypothetical protein